jgi:hypothetical protein
MSVLLTLNIGMHGPYLFVLLMDSLQTEVDARRISCRTGCPTKEDILHSTGGYRLTGTGTVA